MGTMVRKMSNIIKKILSTPWKYDCFQAIFLLQKFKHNKNLNKQDINQITLSNELNFKNCFKSISRMKYDKIKKEITIYITSLQIFGQNGVLPDHFTENLQKLRLKKENGLEDLINLFYSKSLWSLYKQWERTKLSCKHTKAKTIDVEKIILSTVGGCYKAIPKYTQLYFSGILSNRSRSVESIIRVLTYYFGLPFQLNEFTNCLVNTHENGINKKLGKCILGSNYNFYQYCFNLIIGPIDYTTYCNLLPINQIYSKIISITKELTRGHYTFNIQFVVKSSKIRCMRLGKSNFLGWNTWCLTTKKTHTATILTKGYNHGK